MVQWIFDDFVDFFSAERREPNADDVAEHKLVVRPIEKRMVRNWEYLGSLFYSYPNRHLPENVQKDYHDSGLKLLYFD